MSGELIPAARNDLRASHEDRDFTVERLRIAAGDGRIDAEELDQRIEAALSARTYGELAAIVKDLPESAEASARAVARRAESVASRAITLAHSSTTRTGAWLVPQELVITGGHSSIWLDFSEAVFPGARNVVVRLDVRHSNVKISVPDGSTVQADGVAWLHSNLGLRNLGPKGPDSVHIQFVGTAAHSSVRVKRLTLFMKRRRARRTAIAH